MTTTHFIMTLYSPEELPTKQCSKCKLDLPLDRFSNNSGRSYTRSECRDCTRKLAKHIESYKSYTMPDNYHCPICLKSEEECRGLGGTKAGTWCVDHDHSNGEFRGWLCHSCNRTIGNFHDDIEKMKRAVSYLQGEYRVDIEIATIDV